MEDRSRRRNVARAIPATAVSRRRPSSRESNQFDNDEPDRRIRRRQTPEEINSNESVRSNFGERRNSSRNAVKTGSRPRMNQTVSRQDTIPSADNSSSSRKQPTRSSIRQQTSKDQVEDASFKDTNSVKKPRQVRRMNSNSTGRSTPKNQPGRYTVGVNKKKPRDNSSRFDD